MNRRTPPSMDFYPDDFLTGTAEMEPVELAIYIRLLCFNWTKQMLPLDTSKLMRLSGVYGQEFLDAWSEVQKKFTYIEGEGWTHHRIQHEMAKKLAIRDKRAESGRLGGQANAKQMLKQKGSKGKLEVGSRKKEVIQRKDTQKRGASYTPEFERFWRAYPPVRKSAKRAAFKAWTRALEEGADSELIIQKAEAYAGSYTGGGEFSKAPATWLNGACWLDDPASWDAPRASQGDVIF